MASIEELMATLGAMEYQRPSSYTGYKSGYTPVNRGIPGVSPIEWNMTPEDFKIDEKDKKDDSGFKMNIWEMLSGTLGQPGGLVTDSVYKTMEKWKDDDVPLWQKIFSTINPLNGSIIDGAKNGGKKQWENWTDGEWSWGDIPGVGFLNGMDEGWKRGTDIAEDHLGMEEGNWKTTATGIGIDIVADPLTYLTGGASLAGKAGKAAEVAEIAKHAKNLNIGKKFKNVDEFSDAAIDALRAKYAKYPNLADRMVAKKWDEISKSIETARTKAYNQNINKWGVSVPFSNKMSTAVADLGAKSVLRRTEATLGSQYSHVADNIFEQFGVTDPSEKAAILQKMFGKTDNASLTKGEVDALATGLDDATKRLSAKNGSLKLLPDSDIAEVGVRARRSAPGTEVGFVGSNIGRVGAQADEPIERWIRDVQPTLGNRNIGKQKLTDFVEEQNVMFNGKTKFEHWLDRKNPFDARTLKTGDQYLDSMANHIADANSRRLGDSAKYIKGLSAIEKATKKMSPDEMKDAIYLVEGKFPNGRSVADVSENTKKLAGLINNLTKQIGDDDVSAGVLNGLKENYFPHVINRTDEEMEAMLEFDKRHPDLNGLNQQNKFDQSRKSFQTIADRDNYVNKLANAISKATDPAEKAALEEQLKRVEDLFDTDVVSALQRRVREGVRARAMKAMQGELKKFGMAVSNPKSTNQTKGLKKLEPSEAKKLGLGKGEHFMHPKVLEGLKRTDEIFTDQGMEKWKRHLAAMSDIWRPLVTYYKPSHYRNNLIGNTFNNLAAGVKPSDVKGAMKLLKAYRSGKATPDQMKIINAAYKHNVISGGFLFDSQATFKFDDPTWLEKAADKVGNNKAIKWARGKGEVIDDVSRLANFVNGLGKYGKADRAAQQVREYLFNYNELTNADRAMRVVVPFWNWTKRNIPLQMKLLMEQPKFALNTMRLRDLFNDDDENGKEWQKNSGIEVPQWISDMMGADGQRYYTSIPSPVNDLEMLTNPRNVLSSIHPAAQMGIELPMNQTLFTGDPISYGSDNVQEEDILRYLASKLGVAKNIYQSVDGSKTPGESLVNFFNPITKVNEIGGGGN